MRKTDLKRTVCFALTALMLCAMLSVSVSAGAVAGVNVGGMPFGVRFKTVGVTVAELEKIDTKDGYACPAEAAGLASGDIITKVNGKDVSGADEVIRRIAGSGGKSLEVTYTRHGEEHETILTPIKDGRGIYRAGMWIRDSAAGIGTVTYYDAKTGEFAGLGHGICDAETGELIPLSEGIVTDVSISGINKGAAGAPGELKGFFGEARIGQIAKNTRTGVYGTLRRLPRIEGEYVEIATRNEVKTGAVTVRCTLADGEMRDYAAEIAEIDAKSADTKNFIVKITDPELLARTGGIVQGMSGSPILQNGKLVGAVTHVMVNDPTRGYGIFIENMMNAE